MLALLLRDKRIKNKIKKPLNLVSSWIVFVCIVFSILPGYLRYKGILLNYWYAFDQIFTNRSMLAASAFQSYGIPIVNTMNYNAYTNTPVYIDGYMNNGVVLDSAYIYGSSLWNSNATIFMDGASCISKKAKYKHDGKSGIYSSCGSKHNR